MCMLLHSRIYGTQGTRLPILPLVACTFAQCCAKYVKNIWKCFSCTKKVDQLFHFLLYYVILAFFPAKLFDVSVQATPQQNPGCSPTMTNLSSTLLNKVDLIFGIIKKWSPEPPPNLDPGYSSHNCVATLSDYCTIRCEAKTSTPGRF